jgi:Flp pilus assembly protein TadG
MIRLLAFLRDGRGASAAEFALVLPLFLLFLLGIVDAGRYAWEFNEAEKATQIGARWAVATDVVPSGLASYSFAVSGGISQGTTVPKSSFGGIWCASDSGTVSCTCKDGNACAFGTAANSTAFQNLVTRMAQIYPNISAANVRIDYDWSGLGFAGDPNGPDVAPLVTVSLRTEPTNRVKFQPMTLMLFSGTLPIPSASYTLTMEDGQGTDSN